MDLRAYLQRENMRPSHFAARIGKPASTITRLLNGKRRPSLQLMKTISEATNGVVTPNDFMPSGEPP